MAITNYSTLQAAVASWLGRSDMTAIIPDLITMAERGISRDLRVFVVVADYSLTSAAVAVPALCTEVRSIRHKASGRNWALTQVTMEALADLKREGSGIPQYFAVVNNTVYLDITPSVTTYEIVYYSALVPLSDVATTNATLGQYPDIYLFGALKEAEPYLEHDERIALWEAKYAKAVTDANSARERAELGAAPKARRLPVVFG